MGAATGAFPGGFSFFPQPSVNPTLEQEYGGRDVTRCWELSRSSEMRELVFHGQAAAVPT